MAAKYGSPILLSNSSYLPESIKDHLNEQKAEKALILGGDKSVSSRVYLQVKENLR